MISSVPCVADYMTPGPSAIAPSETLRRADQRMRDLDVHHLPVVDRGRLVGIVSSRDLELVWSLAHAEPDELTVEDAMSAPPFVVPPNAPLQRVARLMAKRRIGSAIVVDRAAIVGVFTVTDALAALAETLEGSHVEREYDWPPGRRERSLRSARTARR